jgi:hypothetical protein
MDNTRSPSGRLALLHGRCHTDESREAAKNSLPAKVYQGLSSPVRRRSQIFDLRRFWGNPLHSKTKTVTVAIQWPIRRVADASDAVSIRDAGRRHDYDERLAGVRWLGR